MSYAWPGSGHGPVAVMLPGARYTAQAPLLYWCATMLVEWGWHVQAVEWDAEAAGADDPEEFVERAVVEAFDSSPPVARRLVIAKSLGSYTLPWARRSGVPGVWLTPILTSDTVRRALMAAGPADLAVGGEADAYWRPTEVAGTTAQLLSVPDANHALEVPGDWHRSTVIQREILERISRHLEL